MYIFFFFFFVLNCVVISNFRFLPNPQFDVGGPEDGGTPLQVLSGHLDRVYSVHFHPSEPILASCSADSKIRRRGTVS